VETKNAAKNVLEESAPDKTIFCPFLCHEDTVRMQTLQPPQLWQQTDVDWARTRFWRKPCVPQQPCAAAEPMARF